MVQNRNKLLYDTALGKHTLTKKQAEDLFSDTSCFLPDIIAAAGMVAANLPHSRTAAPFTCGILNAKSGRCGENCAFCAQSSHYITDAAVYPLVEPQKMLERAQQLAKCGADYMGIVTSGTSPSDKDFEIICAAATCITREVNIKLCASLGVLLEGQAERLKEAGFTSYHHNLETAPSYYPNICTTRPHEARINTVKLAKKAGLRVCSGGIFGMGETWGHRLELAETLCDLNVDSIPINFLSPISGTPLENAEALPSRDALLIIALFRLMLPKRDIVICGGRSKTLDIWESSLFFAGANGLMIGDYLTTKGSALQCDLNMLQALGGKFL